MRLRHAQFKSYPSWKLALRKQYILEDFYFALDFYFKSIRAKDLPYLDHYKTALDVKRGNEHV